MFGRAEAARDFAGEKVVKSGNGLQSKRYNDLFQSWAEEISQTSTHKAEGGDFKP